MADQNELPSSFPLMGAKFEKPYMEFEYNGKLYRVENLKGGHNGKAEPLTTDNDDDMAARACQTRPPVWDEERKRWVVPIENSIIDIDLADQDVLVSNIEAGSPLRRMHIYGESKGRKATAGYLLASGQSREDAPKYPVDCEFTVFIRVDVPGLGSLRNTKAFRLVARDLDVWPPRPGTTYTNLDDVELFPTWLPFADRLISPVARILGGDETILTEVFELRGS